MSKKVLVIGLEKSGHAAIKLLQQQGYEVSVTINNEISEVDQNNLLNVNIYANGHPLTLLDEEWDFIVKNPGVPYKIPFIQEALKRGIKIITEIELGYIYSTNTILALTGTNGKTTTTTLIYNILKANFENVYCGGNIGLPYSDIVLEHPNDNIVMLELSSFQLMGTENFKPHIASILNLAPDHLDYMNSLEEYYESKMAIYKNQDENDYFLYNKDDELLKKYAVNIKSNIIEYSVFEQCDIYLKDNYIYYKDEVIIDTNKVQLIGIHNIYNIMVAIGYAKIMNVANNIIQDEVYSFTGVEYRLQKVVGIKNNVYYNDSKSTTPDSTITAINAFKQEDLVLIVGGFDKGLDFSQLSKSINENESISKVICYGQIRDVFDKSINKEIMKFDNLEKVIEYVINNIDNKIILFSPATSSYDQYKNYEIRGEHFNKLIKGD